MIRSDSNPGQSVNVGLMVSIAVGLLWPVIGSAAPLTPAFTYQARLTDGGVSVNGQVDLILALYDAATFPVGITQGVISTNAMELITDDGARNGSDIQQFVDCVVSGGSCTCADVNGVNGIGLDDVPAFVADLLVNSGCP